MLVKLKILLEYLNGVKRDDWGDAWVDGEKITDKTGLSLIEINDMTRLAWHRKLVDVGTNSALQSSKGYKFFRVQITVEGRLWLETN